MRQLLCLYFICICLTRIQFVFGNDENVETSKPSIEWKVTFAGGIGSISVCDDRIYVGSCEYDRRLGLDRSTLTCLTQAGRIQWTKAFDRLTTRGQDIPGTASRSKVLTENRYSYFFNNRGQVICLDKKKEEPIEEWVCDLPRQLAFVKRDASDVGNPLPTIVGGRKFLYCLTAAGCSENGLSSVPAVVAIDRLTGKVVWKFDVAKAELYANWGTPTLLVRADGTEHLIACCGDGNAYSLDAITGLANWQTKLPVPARQTCAYSLGRPSISDGIAVIGLGEDEEISSTHRFPIVGVDIDSGKIVWSFTADDHDCTVGGASVHQGIAFVLSRNGTVFALDAKTGKQVGKIKLGDKAASYSGVQVDGATIVVASQSAVFVLNAAPDLQLLKNYQFDGLVTCEPSVTEKTLFVGNSNSLLKVSR
jgi:outer membrane protein assembly factor BamB